MRSQNSPKRLRRDDRYSGISESVILNKNSYLDDLQVNRSDSRRKLFLIYITDYDIPKCLDRQHYVSLQIFLKRFFIYAYIKWKKKTFPVTFYYLSFIYYKGWGEMICLDSSKGKFISG